MSDQQNISQSPVAAPYGPIRIPPSSTLVLDADEEIFFLYTGLASRAPSDGTTSFRGLGYIDSHSDTLTVNFTLQSPEPTVSELIPDASPSKHHKRKLQKKHRKNVESEETLEVKLAQDVTSLRSRKGDTGSVLWRASVEFGQYVLTQARSCRADAFINSGLLKEAHVLELGAGTGLLGILLSPLVRHYTATDIDALVPLIRKNTALNFPPPDSHGHTGHSYDHSSPAAGSNITVDSLDWIVLHGASASVRRSLIPSCPVDLLLVVDCIYHPSLLPALLSTIDYVATPGLTTVLVVVELRAEDVVREFLERWLHLGEGRSWSIWSSGILEGPYAVWIGYKNII